MSAIKHFEVMDGFVKWMTHVVKHPVIIHDEVYMNILERFEEDTNKKIDYSYHYQTLK